MASAADWSRAFAIQARADWDCWNKLNALELPECQPLHFLQMACEKLAKAYLSGPGGLAPTDLQSSHAFIRKHLRTIIAYTLKRLEPTGSPARHRTLLKATNQIAGEIEWLHPQCNDNGRRPANTEYPWLESDQVLIPAQHRFALLRHLQRNETKTVLKLICAAIQHLADGASP